MSNLLLLLVRTLVAAIVKEMSPEKVKSVLDQAFDAVEKKVKDTATQWDDRIVLPMLTALRKALDIHD